MAHTHGPRCLCLTPSKCHELESNLAVANEKCKRLQIFIREMVSWKVMTPDQMDDWFERAKIVVDEECSSKTP